MAKLIKTYEEVRDQMLPGDVLAFGGKGNLSDTIKFFTDGEVSHVGIVAKTRMLDGLSGRYFNELIESTSLRGFNGVVKQRISDVIHSYEGEIWWLPLSEEVRRKFNQEKFFNFLYAQIGKFYDTQQVFWSAIDFMDNFQELTKNLENFEKFFCSELVVAGLEEAGVLSNINASEITPMQICQWKIFKPDYLQLKGDQRIEIQGFNSKKPSEE